MRNSYDAPIASRQHRNRISSGQSLRLSHSHPDRVKPTVSHYPIMRLMHTYVALLAASSALSTISLPPMVPVRPLTPNVSAYPGGNSVPGAGSSRSGQLAATGFTSVMSTFVPRIRYLHLSGTMAPYSVNDFRTRLLPGKCRSRLSCCGSKVTFDFSLSALVLSVLPSATILTPWHMRSRALPLASGSDPRDRARFPPRLGPSWRQRKDACPLYIL